MATERRGGRYDLHLHIRDVYARVCDLYLNIFICVCIHIFLNVVSKSAESHVFKRRFDGRIAHTMNGPECGPTSPLL